MNNIEYRKNQQQVALKEGKTAATTNKQNVAHDVGPPPDDYRLLPIIPDLAEILSEERVYLRQNIVNGVYEDARHYLDVSIDLSLSLSLLFHRLLVFFKIHFRLLREDFVSPLRDGIQQYLSRAPGKNFNVRIYENVRCLGARLSPRNGIVYDLCLDVGKASTISWANSRRLIYGNLLLLTFDRFNSCAFVTVEDRTRIEKDGIVSVD